MLRWHKVNNRGRGYPAGTIHWVGFGTVAERTGGFRAEVRKMPDEKAFQLVARRGRKGRIHRGEIECLDSARKHCDFLAVLSCKHPEQFAPAKVQWKLERPPWHPEDEWAYCGSAKTHSHEVLLYEAWHSNASARERDLFSWRALFIKGDEGHPFREMTGDGLVKRCKSRVREALQELG